MYVGFRRVGMMLAAVFGTVLLAIGATVMSALAWATTVLVVPGTGTQWPNEVDNYVEHAVDYYVTPAGGGCDASCDATGIHYDAQFWPIPLAGWGGLEGAKWDVSVQSGFDGLDDQYNKVPGDDSIVIFGYSQGATVASKYKAYLAGLPGGIPDGTSFVLIGNPNRPNGGLFERLAMLGHVPILDATFGEPTPTNTSDKINTTDIALQYDGVADFPKYPINLLATANALAGFWYIHGSYLAPKGDDPATKTPAGYTPGEVEQIVKDATEHCTAATYCQVSGDTRYITLPAKLLPIMQPILDLGDATGLQGVTVPLVDLISPVTRVLIETGYDRSDYGTPSPFGLIPPLDPFQLIPDLALGAVQGVTDAVNGTGDASDAAATEAPATSTAVPDATAQTMLAADTDTDTASGSEDDNSTGTDPVAGAEAPARPAIAPLAASHLQRIGTANPASTSGGTDQSGTDQHRTDQNSIDDPVDTENTPPADVETAAAPAPSASGTSASGTSASGTSASGTSASGTSQSEPSQSEPSQSEPAGTVGDDDADSGAGGDAGLDAAA